MEEQQQTPGSSSNNYAVGKNMNKGIPSIETFREICGVDEETATQLLRESGGSLEAAIHQYFYTNEHPEIIENQQNSHEGELRRRQLIGNQEQGQADQDAIAENENFAIQPNQIIQQSNRAMSWGQWFRALVLLPFRFFYSTFVDCVIFFYNVIIGPPTQAAIDDRTNNDRRAIQEENVILDRILMQQQQNEYDQALAIDRERMLERKRLEHERAEEKRMEMEETMRLKERNERLKQKRMEIMENIQPEPEPSEEELVRIRISFPNGIKIDRRFRRHDSLERLFEAVFVHAECPEDFSILTSYPSVLLQCAPIWYRREFDEHYQEHVEQPKTFAQQGLITSAVVYIQDNEA